MSMTDSERLTAILENIDGESGFRLLGYHDIRRIVDSLIANGVTVQEWYSVNDCMPEDLEQNKGKKVINCIVEHDPYGNGKTTAQFRQRKYDKNYKKWHWSKIGGCTVTRWTMMPEPPKGD